MNAPTTRTTGGRDEDRRILLLALIAVPVAMLPVGAAWLLGGAVPAQALYLGIVVTATSVRALPRPAQFAGAAWLAVAAATGVLIGPATGPLLIAVVLCCLAQLGFARFDARAAAVTPAILVFFALFTPQHTAAASGITALGILLGAAIAIGAAAVVRITPDPNPLGWHRAAAHTLLLACGCAALLLVVPALGLERSNWGLLAFCLVFAPGTDRTGTALRYALATGIGVAVAVGAGILLPNWLILLCVFAGAVLTVAATLGDRGATAVAAIAATVILMGAISADSGAAVGGLGFERFASAVLAVGLATALMRVSGPLERLLARTFPGQPTTPGTGPRQ